MAFGGSECETMALSWGGEECCVGSFVDSVHVEVRGPSCEEDIDTVDDVEETGDGGIAGFEFGDVVVSPIGEFVAD